MLGATSRVNPVSSPSAKTGMMMGSLDRAPMLLMASGSCWLMRFQGLPYVVPEMSARSTS